jgi:hypothetical protein
MSNGVSCNENLQTYGVDGAIPTIVVGDDMLSADGNSIGSYVNATTDETIMMVTNDSTTIPLPSALLIILFDTAAI